MSQNKNDLDQIVSVLTGIGICIAIITTGVFRGIYHFPKDRLLAHIGIYIGMAASCIIAKHKQHLLSFTGWTDWLGRFVDAPVYKLYDSHDAYYFMLLFAVYLIVYFGCIGSYFILQRKRMQKSLDQVGLKNGSGDLAKIKSVQKLNSMQQKMILSCPGVAFKDITDKKDHIASAMHMPVEDIKALSDPALVEVLLSKKTLPKVSHYSDYAITSTYSFRIGETREGYIDQDITKLPHMLIAGTTGGGKSMFFRQALLGLLESSKNIQMCLIDLKQGVEMNDFAHLPNVSVAKNETEAVTALEKICDEMLKRFNNLAEQGRKAINCERDKVDRIIVGIDEASVLFAKSAGKSKEDNELSARARELTHNIAKLGRAAGIHLVLATQKVTKETVDTHIQDNIEGRMIFRMHTPFGSQNVLNAADANKLPDIAGRGIWKCGPLLSTVQAPFISEEEMEHRLKQIKGEFEILKRNNQQELIYIPEETEVTEKSQSDFPIEDDKKGNNDAQN
ncbi:hypothetical protein MRY82_06880 [bacterium]|nr:hypothetical protein [bacterium]